MEQQEQLKKGIEMMILEKYKSLSSFATAAGFDKSDLSKFLNGKKDWQVTKLLKLLSFLKCEITIKSESTDGSEHGRLTTKLEYDDQAGQKFWSWLQKSTAQHGKPRKNTL